MTESVSDGRLYVYSRRDKTYQPAATLHCSPQQLVSTAPAEPSLWRRLNNHRAGVHIRWVDLRTFGPQTIRNSAKLFPRRQCL